MLQKNQDEIVMHLADEGLYQPGDADTQHTSASA
jgi:hypothetical protein